MSRTPTYLVPGERVRIIAPYSEVCMHMKCAGRPMLVEVVFERGDACAMAQLYSLDGKPFSAPVTTGEGGLHYDSQRGFYTYADDGPGDADPEAVRAEMTALLLKAFETLDPREIKVIP